MSTSYSELLQAAVTTLKKYSLARMVDSMDVKDIHKLMRTHRTQLIACDTFENGLLLANKALVSVTGYPMTIQTFVTSETDLRALYNIFVQWRDSILAEKEETV